MSTQTKSSSRPWLVFIGCCVLSLVGFGLIVNTPGLYFTVLGETLNVSRTQIALASSIMAIAGAVTMLFAGKVMKMLDSRILISVCIAGVAALFLAQSFFNAVWQFYISFALMGILYVIPISLAPSVLLANWFESKLGMVMGIALGLSGIGGTIFNPVVSWFITNLGWQTSYRLTALILVICILPFSLLVFKFRPDEAKGEQAYGHIVSAAVADDAQAAGELPGIESKKAYRTPTFVLLVLVSVLLQIVAALVQHVSSHEIAHGLTLEQGALVVSGIMFGAAIGKATIGILLDYLKPELTIVIYSAIGLAGWGLMAVATTPHPGHRRRLHGRTRPRRRARRPAVGHPQVLRPARLQRDPVHRLHVWRGRLRHRRHRAWRRVRRHRLLCAVAGRQYGPVRGRRGLHGHRIPYAPVQGNHEAGQVRPGKTDSRQTYIRNIRSIHE